MKWFAALIFVVAVSACSDDAQDNSPDQGENNLNNNNAVDMASDTRADSDMAAVEPVYNTPEEAFGWVDPFIGSDGLGFSYGGLTPAAQVPNGMVKVGPDTTRNGSHPSAAYHFSGYYYSDPHIRGFSHLHLVGTGVSDLGNLRILPNTQNNLDTRPAGDWWQTSDKDRESSEPGFYAGFLEESQTLAEMSASLHGAVHRYTWEGDGPYILTIDPASSVDDDGVIQAEFTQVGSKTTGFVEFKGGYVGRSRPFTLHYVIEVSAPPSSVRGWNGDQIEDIDNATGTQVGVVLQYDAMPQPLTVRVGVSLIDGAQAQANFDAEVAGKSLEDVRAEAKTLWLDKLSRLRVSDGSERDKTVLFTALYNTYRMPTRFDEYGRYTGLDGQVHNTDHPYYTDLSLWDTYRTLHPWYAIYDPELQRDVLNSLIKMAQDGGYVPSWPAALSYTGGMVGTSADVLFGESAAKGIEGVDYAAAFALLEASHDTPDGAPFRGRPELDAYLQYGFVPADLASESAAFTLEYATHDAGMASLAEYLGLPEAADYRARSAYYQNLFDEETGFLRPRNVDGSWQTPFVPAEFSPRSGGPYTEGTAYHWTLHAPHDPEGLRDTMGQDALFEMLETIFGESKQFNGVKALWAVPDTRYWHGNQPPLHNVFLYATVGRLDRLGYWTRQIQKNLYDETPDGLIGNDDGGTLSSWFLFSAVGFYPVVTTDRYLPSPPLFENAQIELQNGAVVQVTTEGVENAEIEAISKNGAQMETFELLHEELLQGANLGYKLQ